MTDVPTHDSSQTSQSKDQSSEGNGSNGNGGSNAKAANPQATVIVRGETVKDSQSDNKDSRDRKKPPADEVSEAKVKLQSRLPALDDDADVGVQKAQVVTRDGKADLAFTGTLLASAAPETAPNGEWQEFRIYETDSANYVFSKVTRNIKLKEDDTHEAEVFEPEPSSTTSKLLRGAADLARSHPLTWKDAAVKFFGYDPLAKALYRKLGPQFEEHIS